MIFSIRAFVCTLSEMMPACLPVKDCALWPSDWMAMARSAMVTRSPVETSMSISRGSGFSLTWFARLMSLSVSPLMAETHHHHIMALFPGADNAPRHVLDPLGIPDGCSAVFLNYEHLTSSAVAIRHQTRGTVRDSRLRG